IENVIDNEKDYLFVKLFFNEVNNKNIFMFFDFINTINNIKSLKNVFIFKSSLIIIFNYNNKEEVEKILKELKKYISIYFKYYHLHYCLWEDYLNVSDIISCLEDGIYKQIIKTKKSLNYIEELQKILDKSILFKNDIFIFKNNKNINIVSEKILLKININNEEIIVCKNLNNTEIEEIKKVSYLYQYNYEDYAEDIIKKFI
ncbi:MAG: hypothetical protein N2485_08560, partial [bacterium]|nr:hypothetical protein [bacterium]